MSRRRHRFPLRRILWTAAVLLALFTLGGFFLLPPLVRTQLERRLAAELGRPVAVGRVQINPYALSLAIENLEVGETGGRGTFLAWRRLLVDFEALASLRGDWVLGAIELDGLRATVQVRPDGSLNFSDLLAKFTAAPAPEAPLAPAAPARPLRIGRLNVQDARLDFTDQSQAKPFATRIGPLTFSVAEFHTRGARDAAYRFEAVSEAGEKFAWQGTLQAAPFRSTGELRLENILLAKYAPYHGKFLHADVTEGKIGLRGRYEVSFAQTARAIRLLEGAVQVRGLRLLERASQEPLLELPFLDFSGIHADALAPRLEVGTVALVGAYLRARREKDGRLNLVSIFQAPQSPPATTTAATPASTASAAPAAPAPPAPDIRIAEVTVRESAVDLVDLTAPRPVWIGLTALQCSLKKLTLAEGAAMPVQFACKWAPKGTVRLDGTVSLTPALQATLQTQIAGLEFLPLSPYLEQFVNARITQGSFSTSHTLRLDLSGGRPAVTFEGGVKIEKFGLVDAARNEDLVTLGALALTGVKLRTSPEVAVAVGEVNLTAPSARLIVNPDSTLNLAAIFRPPAAGPAPAATPPAAAVPATAAPPPPRIDIAKVVIADGSFSLLDFSIEPHVRTTLGQFGGTIAGLSSENLARADVALKGTVDGTGPVAITGRIDPLGATRFVDLTVDCKNVDLVAFSPYSGKYAGLELTRGKLGADLRLRLDGPKLDASNVVRLDRLTFGAPVPSADATKLPVRLGVALLKDLDGRIVIDLPIQGRLDDPEFKIGRVVGRVLVNLLTKVATSPFKLLGSMFGGGGDELAFQEFAPGSSALQPAELGKLATMIKALGNRPELSLALEGGADPAADIPALKRRKLAEQVRRGIWEQKRATDPAVAPPDQLVISADEEAAMLKTLFDQRFPPGTEFGTPLPPAPPVVRPPDPPRGLLERLIRAVTGREKLEQAAARAENERRALEHKLALERAITSGRPVDEMLGRLVEITEISPNDLAALAAARAQSVRDHIVQKGHIAADRLFLAKSVDPAHATKGPRVFLSLQ